MNREIGEGWLFEGKDQVLKWYLLILTVIWYFHEFVDWILKIYLSIYNLPKFFFFLKAVDNYLKDFLKYVDYG